MPSKDQHINFRLMRDRILADQNGKQFWRSLEELTDSAEFQEFVEREYPQHAEEWHDPVGRRNFLKLMGASLALAGLSSCVMQPAEKVVPYVNQPEEIIPGKALYFATAMPFAGTATPLLVRSNEGRPTKIEGNPDHPNNRNTADANDKGTSATDLFAQASILTLYDPDRQQTLTYREEIRPWTAFVADINTALEQHKKDKGAGLRFLTETITSPTLASQLRAILTEYSGAKWHQYEPAARMNAHAGAMAAFNEPVNTIYRFDQADRILAIESDFLSGGPGSVRYARDFSAKRRVAGENKTMNRLYAIESTPTNTGAMADHRLSVRPSEIESVVRAIATALGGVGVNVKMDTGGASYTAHSNWITAVARDLVSEIEDKGTKRRVQSLVVVGDEQPASVHALAHAMNEALGNIGKTVSYTEPVEARVEDQTASLRALLDDIDNKRVQTLIILGGNPVYNTPADLKLNEARMNNVDLRVHLSLYRDETSELCHWNVPESHYLEAWSDARSFDGTVSIIQPLIAPLYESRSAHELLAVFSNQSDRKGYDIVRDFWQGEMASGGKGAAGTTTGGTPGQGLDFANKPILTAPLTDASTDFEMAWRKAVHDGFIPNTAAKTREGLTVKTPGQGNATLTPNPQPPTSGFEIIFRTDPSIYDGRFANNGWLQELPKPMSKLTWDNVALLSPATAQRLGVNKKIGSYGGDIYSDTVKITYAGRAVVAPVWITPGQPDDVVTVHLGFGRRLAGRVGNGVGFDAYQIRTADSPWSGGGVTVARTGDQYALAATQLHHLMENRDIVREKTLTDYLKEADEPEAAHKEGEAANDAERREELYNESMYPRYDYSHREYAWGMAIDVSSCVGCNACVVACQSENNIPIVGKVQVQRSREMHWLRIDSYYKGEDENNPQGLYYMPVLCQQCENAPCEPVCPVHATVHSAEGLNDMVYNRCVGTRYCSNNCPYKVRRFNFLLYQDWETPTYKLMRNPEVTVRSRGVMEKCTYCVQRIQNGKIEAEKEGRVLTDGEVVTACQSVCPTEAIVFGNINDPNSRVSKLKKEQRNYSLLADLNTQPRTTYLAVLKNPNPEITEKV